MQTQHTIITLNRLTRICRDGEDFCRLCAGRLEHTDLRALLRQRREEWGRLGDELQALVLLLGGEPATAGTLAARARRAWTLLRTALFAGSEMLLLEEWHGMQEQALQRYEEAVGGYLPERIRRTISLQADRIADRYEQIGVLRGRYTIRSQNA